MNVLVPSSTVRFSRSGRRKSLGIAYAEFATEKQAELAVKELDGALLNGKKISMKKSNPYTPLTSSNFGARYFHLTWKWNKPLKSNNLHEEGEEEEADDDENDDDDDEVEVEEEVREDQEDQEEARIGGPAPSFLSQLQVTQQTGSDSVVELNENENEAVEAIELIDGSSSTQENGLFTDRNLSNIFKRYTILLSKITEGINMQTILDYFKDVLPFKVTILKVKKTKFKRFAGEYKNILVTFHASQGYGELVVAKLKTKEFNGKHVKLLLIDQNKEERLIKNAQMITRLPYVYTENVNELQTVASVQVPPKSEHKIAINHCDIRYSEYPNITMENEAEAEEGQEQEQELEEEKEMNEVSPKQEEQYHDEEVVHGPKYSTAKRKEVEVEEQEQQQDEEQDEEQEVSHCKYNELEKVINTRNSPTLSASSDFAESIVTPLAHSTIS